MTTRGKARNLSDEEVPDIPRHTFSKITMHWTSLTAYLESNLNG